MTSFLDLARHVSTLVLRSQPHAVELAPPSPPSLPQGAVHWTRCTCCFCNRSDLACLQAIDSCLLERVKAERESLGWISSTRCRWQMFSGLLCHVAGPGNLMCAAFACYLDSVGSSSRPCNVGLTFKSPLLGSMSKSWRACVCQTGPPAPGHSMSAFLPLVYHLLPV